VLLRLLHPTIPFVTELLWTTLTERESVVVAQWPEATGQEPDEQAAGRIAAVRKLVTEIRRLRADQGLRPGQRVAARLGGIADAGLAGQVDAVRSLAKVTEPGPDFASSTWIEVGLADRTVTVELDLSGVVDVAAERKRLAKDLAVAEKELTGTGKKLENQAFLDKAPAEVVDKIRARRQEAMAEIERINARLAALPAQ
jgi:valyl-tRNA synthetase